MAFETLDIKIKAESGDAESALESVRDSLEDTDAEVEQFDSSLKDAEESTDDLSESGGVLASTLSAVSGSASRADDSIEELGDSAAATTGAVTLLNGGLSLTLTQFTAIAAVLGGVTAGLGAVAGAAGLVVGSGLLAFGEELAGQNRQRLKQINAKIQSLQALETQTGELTATQRQRLSELKEQKKTVEEQTTATGALAAELSTVKEAFVSAFATAGTQFVPLVEDALAALPPLVRRLGQTFAQADLSNVIRLLRGVGRAINNGAVPAFRGFLQFANDVAGVIIRIDTELGQLTTALNQNTAFQRFTSGARDVLDELLSAAEAVLAGDIPRAIRELGDVAVTSIRSLRRTLIGSGGRGGLFNDIIDDIGTFLRNNGRAIVAAGFDAITRTLITSARSLKTTLVGESLSGGGGILPNIITELSRFFRTEGLRIVKLAFKKLGQGIRAVAIDIYNGVAGNGNSILKSILIDLGAFIINRGPGIVVSAFKNLFDLVIAAAKGLYNGLVGNSILTDIITDFGTFLRGRAVTLLTSAANTAFTAFKQAAENAVSYLLGTGDGPSLKSDLLGALRSIATSVKTEIKNKINAAFGTVADAVTGPLDDIDFGGIEDVLDGLLQTANDVLSAAESAKEVADNISFPEPPEFEEPERPARPRPAPAPAPAPSPEPEPDPGDDSGGGGGGGGGGRDTNPDDPAGPTDPNPSPGDDNPAAGGDDDGLDSGFDDGRPGPGDAGGPIGFATGGLIDSGGLAVLHSGERVIPAAQAADRGPAPSGVSIQNLTVNASSRAEGRQAAKGLKDELKRFDI